MATSWQAKRARASSRCIPMAMCDSWLLTITRRRACRLSRSTKVMIFHSFEARISSSRACETDSKRLQAFWTSLSSPCIFLDGSATGAATRAAAWSGAAQRGSCAAPVLAQPAARSRQACGATRGAVQPSQTARRNMPAAIRRPKAPDPAGTTGQSTTRLLRCLTPPCCASACSCAV